MRQVTHRDALFLGPGQLGLPSAGRRPRTRHFSRLALQCNIGCPAQVGTGARLLDGLAPVHRCSCSLRVFVVGRTCTEAHSRRGRGIPGTVYGIERSLALGTFNAQPCPAEMPSPLHLALPRRQALAASRNCLDPRQFVSYNWHNRAAAIEVLVMTLYTIGHSNHSLDKLIRNATYDS